MRYKKYIYLGLNVTVWFQIDPKGGTVYVGFNDGVVRVLQISKHHEQQIKKKHHHECSLELLQAFKPHSADVTSMAIDSKGEILATGVS